MLLGDGGDKHIRWVWGIPHLGRNICPQSKASIICKLYVCSIYLNLMMMLETLLWNHAKGRKKNPIKNPPHCLVSIFINISPVLSKMQAIPYGAICPFSLSALHNNLFGFAQPDVQKDEKSCYFPFFFNKWKPPCVKDEDDPYSVKICKAKSTF